MADDKQKTNPSRKIVWLEPNKKSKNVRVPPADMLKPCHEEPSVSGLTSSMPPINLSEVPRGHYTINFSEVFTVYDLKEDYVNVLKKRNFRHAYDILLTQQTWGPVGLHVNYLKRYHEILLLTGKSELAAETRKTMADLMVESIEVDQDEIIEFAQQLQNSKKFFDAMLFCYIAAFFYRHRHLTEKMLTNIDRCVFQLAQSITMFWQLGTEDIQNKNRSCLSKLIAESNLRSLIKYQLIPMLFDLEKMILKIDDEPKYKKCLYGTLCAHRIEYCQGFIGDQTGRERTIRDAIQAMSLCFGPQSEDYQVVGHLLNNLGNTYECMHQYDSAAMYYNQAIDAYKHCKIYVSIENVVRSIEKAEKNLKHVKTITN
ncbi:unnamed protein product [Clavelina lepadiformis]|uniref:Uncharacterized protein n=1 Tax=Clavelina lepadiformis TaxID=159417 RepID=A0ABP0F009_CLALP